MNAKKQKQTAKGRLAKAPDELRKIAALAMLEGDRELAFKTPAFADDIAADGKSTASAGARA